MSVSTISPHRRSADHHFLLTLQQPPALIHYPHLMETRGSGHMTLERPEGYHPFLRVRGQGQGEEGHLHLSGAL